jgi:hypothetical protein
MERKDFEKLTPDRKWIIIESYQNLLSTSIHNRMGLLPLMSGLAATLLVIATFNGNLLILDCLVKIIVSILLAIIPVSLFFYNHDLKLAAKKSKEQIGYFLDKKDIGESDQNFINKVTGWLPDIVIYIFTFVIIVIIYKIFNQ